MTTDTRESLQVGGDKSMRKSTFVAVMFLVCLVDFADRSVFAVLAQSIKVDLKLSDFQIGILQGLAFALLYAVVGLPIARLSERFSRRKIIAACTLFWSSATLWCGFAGGFFQLVLGRAGVGIGEAGFLPAANSMVGDQFPREKRASTMSLIMLGTPIGILVGAVAGGYLASIAGWRAAFYLLGAFGILVAALVLLLVKEPVRGAADGLKSAVEPAPGFGVFLRTFWQKKALIYIVLGGTTAGFGMSSMSQFLAIFLARSHDLDVKQAAQAYGLISATFLALGLLIGSFTTDRLSRYDRRWPAWGSAIGLGICPIFFWFALGAQTLLPATILLIIGGTFMLLFYGPSAGMIQNLLDPRMRATGAALFAMFYTLIGTGLGPAFVGYMSDEIAIGHFPGNFVNQCPGGVAPIGSTEALMHLCSEASAMGVQQALQIVLLVFFVSSTCYYLASRHIK